MAHWASPRERISIRSSIDINSRKLTYASTPVTKWAGNAQIQMESKSTKPFRILLDLDKPIFKRLERLETYKKAKCTLNLNRGTSETRIAELHCFRSKVRCESRLDRHLTEGRWGQDSEGPVWRQLRELSWSRIWTSTLRYYSRRSISTGSSISTKIDWLTEFKLYQISFTKNSSIHHS